MKKIEAIIRHHQLDEVRTALTDAGCTGITVTEVRGFGRQKGHMEVYRGTEYEVDFVPKLKVEVIVRAESLHNVLDAILRSARTDQIGDGKVFISDLDDTLRIRTGETGIAAL